MESWRYVWRTGVVPHLFTQALEALRQALVSDDARLIQGATTQPRPLGCFAHFPAEGACALSFGPWQAEGLVSVAEVEESFARLCDQIDQCTGEPGSFRYFVTWSDDTPRDVMRRELLCEVLRELALRRAEEPDFPQPLAG